ncbi:MAG TPA: hypothetical protein VFT06_00375 [Flavisolibacter sp.]|nr:hypothetical protein [Flavisolibacter sp.]
MLTIEEQKVDTILGVLFKNSDASDEPAQTWLDGDKFHPVAEQILSVLQPKEEQKPQLPQASVIRWRAFKDEKPPLFTTVCMCYKDGRLDGGVFNSKAEVQEWEQTYKPVAWFVVPLPSFL